MAIAGIRVVTLEEHHADPEVLALLRTPHSAATERLLDLADARIAAMDAAGVDVQVLSHAPPGLQGIGADAAPALATRVNDRLAAAVARHPSRFAALASLPTAAPEAAADELERVVSQHGFKGGIVNGLTGGLFLDDPRFAPVLSRAATLGVPLYLHPSDPVAPVREAYFGDYARTHPMFLRAAWGYTFETGTHAMRLVLSGALDTHPGLHLILGHFGEAIPFLLPRIQEALARDTPTKNFREVFSRHFHVTTSGFFSDPALLCCMQELGMDRIMFSVDWPYASMLDGSRWATQVALADGDRRKLLHANADKLLQL